MKAGGSVTDSYRIVTDSHVTDGHKKPTIIIH